MWVRSKQWGAVNPDTGALAKTYSPKDGEREATTVFFDGEGRKVCESDGSIEQMAQQIIPNQNPGIYMIFAMPPENDGEDWLFWEEPIIAWSISFSGGMRPRCLSNLNGDEISATYYAIVSEKPECVDDISWGDTAKTKGEWKRAVAVRWDVLKTIPE